MPNSASTALVVAALLHAVSSHSSETHAGVENVFNPEMIGANVAYLEKMTGPAWRTDADVRSYKVGRCVVQATIANGSVRAIGMAVSEACTVDINRFLPNFSGRFPLSHELTFGRFEGLTGSRGRYFSDCLTVCGNAADPETFMHWSGSRSDGFLEVVLVSVQVKEPALAAARVWHDAMAKVEGKKYVDPEVWNCRPRHDGLARDAYRDVKISSIMIGYDVNAREIKRLTQPPWCP